jgi:hypothetical protein
VAWKKGQSGNPSGRPKTAVGLRAALEKRYGLNAQKLIVKLDALSNHENPRIAFEATKLLLAYHVGPPVQVVEHGNPDGEPFEIVLTDAPGATPDPKRDLSDD